jgi:hypothetical protein
VFERGTGADGAGEKDQFGHVQVDSLGRSNVILFRVRKNMLGDVSHN